MISPWTKGMDFGRLPVHLTRGYLSQLLKMAFDLGGSICPMALTSTRRRLGKSFGNFEGDTDLVVFGFRCPALSGVLGLR